MAKIRHSRKTKYQAREMLNRYQGVGYSGACMSRPVDGISTPMSSREALIYDIRNAGVKSTRHYGNDSARLLAALEQGDLATMEQIIIDAHNRSEERRSEMSIYEQVAELNAD